MTHPLFIGERPKFKLRSSPQRFQPLVDPEITLDSTDPVFDYPEQTKSYLQLRSKEIHRKPKAAPTPAQPQPVQQAPSPQTPLSPTLSFPPPCAFSSRIQKFYSPASQMLDPRDEKISIPFDSPHIPDIRNSTQNTDLSWLKKDIREWLVDLVQIITSISFNMLKTERLSEQEMKNFAAKNILQNVKQLYDQIQTLTLEQRYQLTTFINSEMHKVMEHIAQKYPQAARKGVTKRLRSHIPIIDDRQSHEYDFLVNEGLNIVYREDGDYSENIMKVLNRLISFSGETFSPNDPQVSSNFEVFSQFFEFLFESVSQQPTKELYEEAIGIVKGRLEGEDEIIPYNLKQSFTVRTHLTHDMQQSKKTRSFSKYHEKQILIGQKIPTDVPCFSQEQLQGCKLKSYDSSIHRLLTKWADELSKILRDPQEHLYKRIFKFKDNQGKPVTLSSQLKGALYRTAKKEWAEARDYARYLKKENHYLQTLFAEQKNKGLYSHHDTEVGIMAAKLNETSSHYIFKYLNKVIHLLLAIPYKATSEVYAERDKLILQSVNLVTFKIGDLLRAKCSCSESDLIKILTCIDEMHGRMPEVLRIVRVKNRLSTENNDLLINLFFANKVECEIQLSIARNVRKDQKNFYTFSHFIYEVIRSQLGPICQLSSIVVQYDPLARVYSKSSQFAPQVIKCKMTSAKVCRTKVGERFRLQEKHNIGGNLDLPFICKECSRLSIVQNPQFFYRGDSIECNLCRKELLSSRFKVKDKDSWQSQPEYAESVKHILDINYENQDDKLFMTNHLNYWEPSQLINQLREAPEDEVPVVFFPPKGLFQSMHQKYPKLSLFTSTYFDPSSSIYFATKRDNGEKVLLATIEKSEDKEQFIANIEKQFKRICLYKFEKVKQTVKSGKLIFKCNQQGCCGKEFVAGNSLTRRQMIERASEKVLEWNLQCNKSVLYTEGIDNCLAKLSYLVDQINEKPKREKHLGNIKGIEAGQCNIQDIMVVSRFSNLQDLNISNNYGLESLQGIDSCRKIRTLNCRGCNISSIVELKGLKKLEYLDLGENANLESLEGLQGNTSLVELSLRSTKIEDVETLSECRRLEFLDLSNCVNLRSIKDIKSLKLSYLNVVGCTGIQEFDLPLTTLKSLKSIEYQQQPDATTTAFELVFKGIDKVQDKLSHIQSEQDEEEAYRQIVENLTLALKKKDKEKSSDQSISVDLFSF